MPNWNLNDDWPEDYKPRNAEGALVSLFEMPISQDDVRDRDDYFIQIARYRKESDGSEVPDSDGQVVKLIITIASTRDIEVRAMTPGLSTISGNTAFLESHCFCMRDVYDMLERTSSSPPEREEGIGLPIIWLENWDSANRMPHRITYENIQPPASSIPLVNAGDVIGTAASPSREYAEIYAAGWEETFITNHRQVRLKFEYDDSIDSDQKCIHPREFFSLLFWREEKDPVFKDRDRGHLSDYEHPLLQKMMRVYDDGSPVENSGGSAVSSIRDVLDNLVPNDDEDYLDKWIGLRPPLRTYKRVEWEARLTHIFHHNNWQTRKDTREIARPDGMSDEDWVAERVSRRTWNRERDALTSLGLYGDLRVPGGIRNPLINNRGYSVASKCNILAGELAFRAGFRVFCQRSVIRPLSYLNTTLIVDAPCDSIGCISSAGDTIEYPEGSGNHYILQRHFGRKINVPVADAGGDVRDNINWEINNRGRLYIHSRRGYTDSSGDVMGHVVVLARLDTVSANNITGRILDQHCTRADIPKDCIYRRPCGGCDGPTGRAFIYLYPGGDPTELWGILDLNCLVEVP